MNPNGAQGSVPNQSLDFNQGVNPIGVNAQITSPNQGGPQAGNLGLAWKVNLPQIGGPIGNPNQGSVVLLAPYMGDQGNPSLGDALSQAAEGLLAESLPINLKALDQAIENYLGRIDALGDGLTELLVSDGMPVGLGGLMAALAMGAVVFEWQRRSRSRLVSLVDSEGRVPQWFLEPVSRV